MTILGVGHFANFYGKLYWKSNEIFNLEALPEDSVIESDHLVAEEFGEGEDEPAVFV